MPSLQINQPLFHATISQNPMHAKVFNDDLYNQSGDGGKFHITLGRRFGFNRFQPRTGEWSTAWPMQQIASYAMPTYDPNFNKTFAQVTDERALDIKRMMSEDPDQKIALYYSGGIDSLCVLVALLKALNDAEKSRLTLCMSMDSVIEYPTFFEDYIYGKFNIIDLKMGHVRYNNLFDQGYKVITADSGDAMFGTEVSTQFYYSYKNYINELSPESIKQLDELFTNVTSPETHYSKFADLIIAYFGNGAPPGFGRAYYEKLVKLSNTSQYPIYSLHDFFWQIIFNIKWMHCGLRGTLFFGDCENHKDPIEHLIINWFNTDDYQRWSMVNNNTGEKIRGITSATYKWTAREYLHDFTKDDYYKFFKLKLASLPKIGQVAKTAHAIDVGMRFALDTNYDLIRFTDPGVKDYINHHLAVCQRDW